MALHNSKGNKSRVNNIHKCKDEQVGVRTRSMTLVCLSTDYSEADSRAGPICTVNTSLHDRESGTMYLNKRIFNHRMRTCHTNQEARDRAVIHVSFVYSGLRIVKAAI